MLPVALSSDGRLPGGVLNYLGRRARRILPPYYAALFLSLTFPIFWKWLIHAVGRAPGETRWHLLGTLLAAGIGSPSNLLAHLLVLHNLNRDWICSYCVPFWSVAPEWEFYFLLPAILLPLWRRFGVGVMVGVALLLTTAPHFLLPPSCNLDWTLPWLFALFALGSAAAAWSVPPRPASQPGGDAFPGGGSPWDCLRCTLPSCFGGAIADPRFTLPSGCYATSLLGLRPPVFLFTAIRVSC